MRSLGLRLWRFVCLACFADNLFRSWCVLFRAVCFVSPAACAKAPQHLAGAAAGSLRPGLFVTPPLTAPASCPAVESCELHFSGRSLGLASRLLLCCVACVGTPLPLLGPTHVATHARYQRLHMCWHLWDAGCLYTGWLPFLLTVGCHNSCGRWLGGHTILVRFSCLVVGRASRGGLCLLYPARDFHAHAGTGRNVPCCDTELFAHDGLLLAFTCGNGAAWDWQHASLQLLGRSACHALCCGSGCCVYSIEDFLPGA
jgi:hypothetical protein